MADGPLFQKSSKDTQCDKPQNDEHASHSAFGGLLGVMGKARCAAQEKAQALSHTAGEMAHRASVTASEAMKNAPKVGDQIDKGSKSVQGALKTAPEPVRNIVGGAVTTPMHSAADLTRLPAEIQKHGMTPDIARRAAGDAVGLGTAAMPVAGAPAAGILGHVLKGAAKDTVVAHTVGGTVKDQAAKAAQKTVCTDEHAQAADGKANHAKDAPASSKALQYGCAVNEGVHTANRH
jgi:hypothetical protein